MTALTLRNVKGTPLTNDELDDNFTYLDGNVQAISDGLKAKTKEELLTGPDPIYPGAYGPNPSYSGLQFYADDTAGDSKVFASIQAEVQSNVAGAVDGRLHFLVNDGDFLQVIGTVDRDGAWILGPGAPSYQMEIAGGQTINSVPAPGPVFGERLSVQDPDYDDCRGLAIRNVKTADLSSLGYQAGIGFSVLNSAGKERPTGCLRARYSNRTANSESSYMYPTSLSGGVQTDGPYFHNGGVYFQLVDGVPLPAHRLAAYEEGTWTPSVEGTSGAVSGTWDVRAGTYVVVGSLMFVSFYVRMTSPTAYPTGAVIVRGFPFSAKYNPQNSNQTLAPGYASPGGQLTGGYLTWTSYGSNGVGLVGTNASWLSGGSIVLSGSGVLELI